MQKIIGFLMIITGCFGLGVWYSGQFKAQLKGLQEMCRILELLEGEIRFGRSTLPECCLQLTDRVAEPYKSCFREIYDTTCENQGETFGTLCKEVLDKKLKELVVDKSDKDLFVKCFSQSGFSEGRMQLRIIEQTKEELEERLHKLNRESADKCRLALSLGAMSGLLLVILFI